MRSTHTPIPFVILLGALSGIVLLGGGCQGGGLNSISQGGGNTASRGPACPAEAVVLTDADLAPIDSYLQARNSQWILGDTVDVYASREYFGQMMTLNGKVGLVHRKEEQVGDDTVVTMTFIGHEMHSSAMSNPRVMVGTGLTITARKTLRVRMAKTVDARRPVQIRVVAHGNASRGRRDQVLERAPQLETGGVLQKKGDRYVWQRIGG